MDSNELLASARKHMTPNYRPPPFVLDHGRGTRAWDTDGNVYLDFAGGIGVLPLGHAHPAITAAIHHQSAELCHTSNLFHHSGYIRLCQALAEISFGQRVFLTNSGAEAVEAALKLARYYFATRGEPRIEWIAAHHSFHGRTFGALSVTGQPPLQDGFGPLVPNVRHIPYGDLSAIRAAVSSHTAAVILEPIQGNGGIIVPPGGYLSAVRDVCDQNGALLILDEVQTGMGRTGSWFAHQQEGVEPHIMALAKMLGGGLPLGAMVATDDIASVLKPGVHATTFGGNPVACAAALATIDVITEDDLLNQVQKTGALLMNQLRQLVPRHRSALEVRGRGLMVGLLLDGPAKPLQHCCLHHGLLTTVAGKTVLRLLPPLNASTEEVGEAVAVIDRALAETSQAPPQ